MASLTGVVIASRRPVKSAVAMARLSPSSVVRIRASIASRSPCIEGGVTQRQAAADRRLHGLDGASDKAGGADALEKHVAAKIVAAGPHRRERRLQPRFQFHKTADRGRGALAHRQAQRSSLVVTRGLSICATRSTKRSVRSRISRASTKPDSDTEYIGLANTPCAISLVFHVATAKPAATRRSSPRAETTFAAAAKTPRRKDRSPRQRQPARPAHDRRRNKTRSQRRRRSGPTATTGRRQLRRAIHSRSAINEGRTRENRLAQNRRHARAGAAAKSPHNPAARAPPGSAIRPAPYPHRPNATVGCRITKKQNGTRMLGKARWWR